MITPSHIIYGWALAKRTERGDTGAETGRVRAYILGALLPDTPTYLLFFIHTFVLGTSQSDLWNTIYFDSAWTPFITLSHSLWLWPLLIALGYAIGRNWLRWIALSATFHVILDFFVHADDAYRHFWPISNWRFESPLSYWDPAHFGQIVGAIDTVCILLILTWLWRTTPQRLLRRIIILLGLCYILIAVSPVLFALF